MYARKLIVSHAARIEGLELVVECSSAMAAIDQMRSTKVDLMFLDIQMPQVTGLEMLRTMKDLPAIIITTAHRDFAIDAFELDVLDYLVKPISFERFLKATNKYFQSALAVKPVDETIQIRSDRKIFPVNLSDIVYIESLDDYVKVHVKDRMLITRENISTLEAKLTGHGFVRIHRSYLIAKKYVQSISGESVFINGKELPFGRAFKQSAMRLLQA